ncbi:hypothetical protein CCACVL1_02506 [Corchorus capsularis]|uniref:Retrovirus-related Pol polyprotein from transposon TNT 1-94-like beta-barrel domain-containing protein n=1 Tax=Corchorus capsularis TaxID=210143 RepID=A0A1R3K803_COCAP|nr:hypothetical protein CCACVL1_02506 [Corchorus capsularis]
MAGTNSGSALKFEIEPFNGTNSFQMWQSTITDVLVQQGLGDALEADKPSAMNDDRWRDIQRKALASVNEVMKDVDKAVLLIKSLTDRYDPVTRALMVGRKTMSLQDVTSAIFEYDKLKETEKKDEENGALTVERGRTNGRDYKNDARLNDSCEEYSDEDVVLMVQEEKKDTRDMWVFDSACSKHICTKKEWFSKLEKCDKSVYMANNGEEKIEGIGSVKLRLHDGSVKMLENVRYVPNFTRNLISLGKLDSLGYGYSRRGGDLKISKGSMIVMKGVENSKNLYELIGSTIRGDGSVSSHQIEKKDVDLPTKKKVTFTDLVKGWSN